MSLQIWLPLNKDLRNIGCADVLTTNNGATFSSDGKIGGSYYFNGSSHIRISMPSSITSIKNSSVSAWIKSTGSIVALGGISSDTNSHDAMFTLYTTGWQFGGGGTYKYIYGGSIANSNVWHHVACTVSDTTITTYLDGVQLETNTLSGLGVAVTEISVANFIEIGADHPGDDEYMTGYVNDFRIYNHCLSVAEVKELAKGLVCHYKLSSDGNDNLLKYTHVNATNKNLLKTNINSSWNNLPITTIDGHECYQYPTAQSPTWFSSGHWFEPMEANTTYTYTAWIYFTANANFNFSSLGHFQVCNANSTASDKSHEDVVAARIYEPSTIKANTWTKVRITFTTNSLAGSIFQIYPRYNIAANTGELYFRDCKLEKNGTPTEWVPNSADVEYNGMGYDSTIVNDCSGYGYNGTKSGTLSRYNDSPRYDSSTTFVDSNSSVTITPYLSNGQKVYSMSVSCWFRTNTMNGGLPNLWSLGENSFLRIRLSSNSTFWYYARVGSTMVSSTYAAGKTLTDNTWHHVVLTFLNGVFVVYLDGVQIGTTDSSSTATYLTCASVGTTWHLAGYSATSESFVGQLSDFRIYTSSLSADDVKALYNTGARIAKTGAMLSYEVKEEG